MDIFKGIPADDVAYLRTRGGVRAVEKGQLLFREGDPAESLYIILSGQVEIFRSRREGDEVLRQLGSGQVFGEMGILADTKTRSAGARATMPSTLFEIQPNPVEFLKRAGNHTAAIRIVQNLVIVLGERLRAKDRGEGLSPGATPTLQGYESDPAKALEAIAQRLPDGLFAKFFSDKKLSKGAVLCEEGAPAEAFYFIRSGVLEVLQGPAKESVGSIAAPAIAGEIGFFGGGKRSATLRAVTEVEYVLFTSRDWAKLVEKSPDEAFQVVYAAAQLAVALILERERGR